MSGPARRIAVTGVGLVSPLGDSLARLADSLAAGSAPFAPVAAFDVSRLASPLAAEVADYDPARDLAEGNHRMLDRTSQLATLAAKRALADAGRESGKQGPAEPAGQETGLALGTMFGSIRTISAFDCRTLTAGPLYAKPMDFANSVLNAAAGQTAIWHHLTGVNATLTGGPVAGLAALAYAAELIRCGRAAALLAGGAEELAFESLLAFERAGRLGCEAPRPFAADRAGTLLGEGACLLMLEDRDAAAARGARVRAEVLGWGSAFDPSRGGDEEAAAQAGARAIAEALAEAAVEPAAIDAVSAGAAGSPDGDRAEALALAQAFGARSAELPVTAVKASLGEALGASGGFQAAALLAAMERGELPGIRGLERPDPELPIHVSASPRRLDLRLGLIHAAGLDGHHTALVLARP